MITKSGFAEWALALCLALATVTGMPGNTAAQSTVDFQSAVTLDDMRQLIMSQFPLGTPRNTLRNAFVTGGKATLHQHPARKATEKYIYDINLCRIYVWRWNISADFDPQDRLQQAYINGFAVFPDGISDPPVVQNAANKATSKVLELQRARPEADRGENMLAYLMLDLDGDLNTIGDQSLIGAGPSRADPANMGKAVYYESVDPWRSIFDQDAADFIAPYARGCP